MEERAEPKASKEGKRVYEALKDKFYKK